MSHRWARVSLVVSGLVSVHSLVPVAVSAITTLSQRVESLCPACAFHRPAAPTDGADKRRAAGRVSCAGWNLSLAQPSSSRCRAHATLVRRRCRCKSAAQSLCARSCLRPPPIRVQAPFPPLQLFFSPQLSTSNRCRRGVSQIGRRGPGMGPERAQSQSQ